MTDAEKVLEFHVIKEKLAEYAYTRRARQEISQLKPYLSESELAARLRETSEARDLLEKAGNPPFPTLEGIEEFFAIAEKGGCLTAPSLEQVAVSLAAVRRLRDYLVRCRQFGVGLAYYEENLDCMEEIREELEWNIRNGEVTDDASKLLQSLRGDRERTEKKMREKADAVMRANKDCLSDSFSTVRNGRVCIPVKKEYKFRINGSVIDQSSTGNTLFMEPASVRKYWEELQKLQIEEENEVRRILYTLSGMLADAADIMKKNCQTIEKLDFIFAKGRLSQEYDGVEPVINTKRWISLVNGRHPLMDRRICVPLNFQIGRGINGIIITGPNTGGKTVAMKTIALNCMMAQCGLHVACEAAEICMSDAYLCDIGDGQNLSENLSTFSAHITNVLDILKQADGDSLVLMDELGSGTDPTEGMGIAVAILEALKQSGALYLVTTHYPEVKSYAAREEGVVNARMTFDRESLKPLYRLVIGEAGESCAFHIAKKLGMPDAMLLRAAEEAYGNKAGEAADKREFFEHTTSLFQGPGQRIQKAKKVTNRQETAAQFKLGDSVMVYPDKKIGIVCRTANDKGVLRVQMQDKKIWINHKRLKLHVAASELYPEDYDFSIVFDTVENRKARHQMERKYTGGIMVREEEES